MSFFKLKKLTVDLYHLQTKTKSKLSAIEEKTIFLQYFDHNETYV
jgi:hypothetical protein